MGEADGVTRGAARRGVRAVKLTVFSIIMVLLAGSLAVVANAPPITVGPFESNLVNGVLSYQISALPVAGLALLLTFAFAGRVRLSYLTMKRTGALRPFFAQPSGGRWECDGWYIGLIMTVIVGVVTFFQFAPGGFTFHWAHIAIVVPLAAMNAFTEEVIFRLPYVTIGENDMVSRVYGLAMGSLVFGVFHFWGAAPNGFLGAVMSALLGYVLATSIQETKGFFWAFTIHAMLDLPVLLFMLNQAP